MTSSAVLAARSGLIAPRRSTAQSESATRLAAMVEEARQQLWTSYSVRRGYERALGELDDTKKEASVEGWNGYGARPMNLEAYLNARTFLESMPSTAPFPEISADPDGDVALDWSFSPGRALSVSISPTGRCSFAWMRGHRTYRGTDWLEDGIPASIANALWRLAVESQGASRR
jgi:hypothetical protein